MFGRHDLLDIDNEDVPGSHTLHVDWARDRIKFDWCALHLGNELLRRTRTRPIHLPDKRIFSLAHDAFTKAHPKPWFRAMTKAILETVFVRKPFEYLSITLSHAVHPILVPADSISVRTS
jgi:hypothetical protein